MKKVFIGSLIVVFAEIALFIIVGKLIGVLPTLLLIITTSVLGVTIAKKRGMKSSLMKLMVLYFFNVFSINCRSDDISSKIMK